MVFVYLDTCVWLSALISRDPKHKTAISILERARAGTYTILVTHHVLNEIFDVLKKKLVTHQSVRNNPTAETLEALVKQKYREFCSELLQLPNIRIKNPNVSTHQVLRPSFSLLYRYLGDVKQHDECPICCNPYDYLECDTIFERDALHVFLAWNLNCDLFVTFDADFEQIRNDTALVPMNIQVS